MFEAGDLVSILRPVKSHSRRRGEGVLRIGSLSVFQQSDGIIGTPPDQRDAVGGWILHIGVTKVRSDKTVCGADSEAYQLLGCGSGRISNFHGEIIDTTDGRRAGENSITVTQCESRRWYATGDGPGIRRRTATGNQLTAVNGANDPSGQVGRVNKQRGKVGTVGKAQRVRHHTGTVRIGEFDVVGAVG